MVQKKRKYGPKELGDVLEVGKRRKMAAGNAGMADMESWELAAIPADESYCFGSSRWRRTEKCS